MFSPPIATAAVELPQAARRGLVTRLSAQVGLAQLASYSPAGVQLIKCPMARVRGVAWMRRGCGGDSVSLLNGHDPQWERGIAALLKNLPGTHTDLAPRRTAPLKWQTY